MYVLCINDVMFPWSQCSSGQNSPKLKISALPHFFMTLYWKTHQLALSTLAL